jgi:hypothetical protein
MAAGGPMRTSVQAAAAPNEGFSPQTVTITAHVNAMFNLK